jgi:hypothetical protein
MLLRLQLPRTIREIRQPLKHSPVPTAAPAFEDVVDYLSYQGVSSNTDLTTEGTPQNRAARWLSELDEAAIQVPEVSIGDAQNSSGYLYTARYVMALNYFELSGLNWTSPANFLSRDDVCSWNGPIEGYNLSMPLSSAQYGGLLCDGESGLPIVLDLGTFTLYFSLDSRKWTTIVCTKMYSSPHNMMLHSVPVHKRIQQSKRKHPNGECSLDESASLGVEVQRIYHRNNPNGALQSFQS